MLNLTHILYHTSCRRFTSSGGQIRRSHLDFEDHDKKLPSMKVLSEKKGIKRVRFHKLLLYEWDLG